MKYDPKSDDGGLVDSMLGSQRWIVWAPSFCIKIFSSELDPLDVERSILRGEGVVTDIRRDFRADLTGETGVAAPARTAGVMDLCPALEGSADAERA